ncbi:MULTISPECIES: hypothetical protein [Streptomyces]|nr:MULTISPECIES: hypothetical protein [Streptomyces]MZD17315.1 hypothetical protein [Streptomyces sp. SID5476]
MRTRRPPEALADRRVCSASTTNAVTYSSTSPSGDPMQAATAELIGALASLLGLGVLTGISVRRISRRRPTM